MTILRNIKRFLQELQENYIFMKNSMNNNL